MQIKKMYCWKKISADGLLKEPRVGSEISGMETINDYCGGFDSEEAAIESLLDTAKRHKDSFHSVPSRLVLVTFYALS